MFKKEQLLNIVSEQMIIDKENIKESNTLENLGTDSLDHVELIIAIEEYFDIEIPDKDINNLKTIKDILSYIENKTID